MDIIYLGLTDLDKLLLCTIFYCCVGVADHVIRTFDLDNYSVDKNNTGAKAFIEAATAFIAGDRRSFCADI